MLIGGDISHHNYPFQVGFGEFQIYKATEGKTYVDPRLADYCKDIKNGDLIGFYHYARPENSTNTPWLEAQNFVATVKKYIGKSIFILDWEQSALDCGDEYALEWLKEVEELTGVKPIVYTSSYGTKKLKAVAKNGYELWVAHYGVRQPKLYSFDKWLMWQFTNSPFDLSLFNGTEADWKARCKSNL